MFFKVVIGTVFVCSFLELINLIVCSKLSVNVSDPKESETHCFFKNSFKFSVNLSVPNKNESKICCFKKSYPFVRKLVRVKRPLLYEDIDSFIKTMPKTLRSFYRSNVKISIKNAVHLCKATIAQDSDLWKAHRKVRVTGSVCYSLYTYIQNRNASWEKKMCNIYNSTFKGNTYTYYGNLYEKFGRWCYEMFSGNTVKQLGLIVDPKAPMFAYSADGVVPDKRLLIEIKCPTSGINATANEVIKNMTCFTVQDGKLSMKKRHPYYGQIQLGMLMTCTDSCDFVVFSSFDNTVFVLNVPFDQEFTSYMVKQLKVIYFNHMLPFFHKVQLPKPSEIEEAN